jgi:putative Mn2+ efflux pump MntP
MSLAGLWMGTFVRAHLLRAASVTGPIALLASGLAVIYLALTDRDLEKAANEEWIVFGLPLSLSIDNLVAVSGWVRAGTP